VFLVENLGMHNLVSLEIEGSTPQAQVLRMLLPTQEPCRVGDRLSVTLPPEAIHWFDTQTGDAVR
jgi:multiple sugar transport system ATP-binding protein